MSYLYLSYNRSFSIKSWIQIFNSSICFCEKYGISNEKNVQSFIFNALFFKFLAMVQFNFANVRIYNESLIIFIQNKGNLILNYILIIKSNENSSSLLI
jgi:hypothetical protein